MARDRGRRLSASAGSRQVAAGVVVSHPVQYFSPLFDLLHERGVIALEVLYGNDAGLREQWDPGFGVHHRWDVDLVSGHPYSIATRGATVSYRELLRGAWRTWGFVRRRDVVVIHGYVGVLIVVAILCCWILRTPYWLRSDSSVRRPHSWLAPQELWPRLVYRRAAGALAAGERNARLARSLGARDTPLAPFAVDNDRFHGGLAAQVDRAGPTVMFGGKFKPAKRPSDVLDVAGRLPKLRFVLVGEGPLGADLRSAAAAQGLDNVEFRGFANQREMPDLLASADVVVLPSEYEPWGLIINEAMAAGAVPVVSDAVGCGPDLVVGLGEVFPVADVGAFTSAVERAVEASGAPDTRTRLWERVQSYSLLACAEAYESAMAGPAPV